MLQDSLVVGVGKEIAGLHLYLQYIVLMES
jgi:hypothetical protein